MDTQTTYLFVGFMAGSAISQAISAAYLLRHVKRDVETTNGRTLGKLAELAEGRRIRIEVAPADRTTRERAYVIMLENAEAYGSPEEINEDIALVSKGQEPQGPITSA